jgi:hypothetical protein
VEVPKTDKIRQRNVRENMVDIPKERENLKEGKAEKEENVKK